MTIVAIALLALGLLLCAANWRCVLAPVFGGRHVSQVPLVPAAFTMIGLRSLEATREWWWVGLLVDPSIPTIVVSIPMLAADGWRTSRFTRVRQLCARDEDRRFTLSLHRNGHFLVRGTCEAAGEMPSVVAFGLVGHFEHVGAAIRLSGYREARVTVLEPVKDGYVAREDGALCEERRDAVSLDALRFRDA